MRSGTAGQTGGRRKRQSDCRESGELGIKLGIKRRLLIPSPADSADKRSSSGPVRLPEPALQTPEAGFASRGSPVRTRSAPHLNLKDQLRVTFGPLSSRR
jgi:hypothetical protein